jgi:ferredoxin
MLPSVGWIAPYRRLALTLRWGRVARLRYREAPMVAETRLKVRIDREKCQGHARCFALAPELFELDEMGNGRERGDGTVPPGLEDKAHLAQANCPELAIEMIEERKR